MRKRPVLIALATGVGALLAGTAAFAAFSSFTSVTTTHQAATMAPLTVVSTDTDYEGDQTALWPGHPADVLITVANPNEVPVKITSASAIHWLSPSCTDPTYYTIRTDKLVAGQLVPARTAAGSGQLTIRIPGAVTLSATAPDSCQGSKITIDWLVLDESA
jgi:hypothetical protein